MQCLHRLARTGPTSTRRARWRSGGRHACDIRPSFPIAARRCDGRNSPSVIVVEVAACVPAQGLPHNGRAISDRPLRPAEASPSSEWLRLGEPNAGCEPLHRLAAMLRDAELSPLHLAANGSSRISPLRRRTASAGEPRTTLRCTSNNSYPRCDRDVRKPLFGGQAISRLVIVVARTSERAGMPGPGPAHARPKRLGVQRDACVRARLEHTPRTLARLRTLCRSGFRARLRARSSAFTPSVRAERASPGHPRPAQSPSDASIARRRSESRARGVS